MLNHFSTPPPPPPPASTTKLRNVSQRGNQRSRGKRQGRNRLEREKAVKRLPAATLGNGTGHQSLVTEIPPPPVIPPPPPHNRQLCRPVITQVSQICTKRHPNERFNGANFAGTQLSPSCRATFGRLDEHSINSPPPPTLDGDISVDIGELDLIYHRLASTMPHLSLDRPNSPNTAPFGTIDNIHNENRCITVLGCNFSEGYMKSPNDNDIELLLRAETYTDVTYPTAAPEASPEGSSQMDDTPTSHSERLVYEGVMSLLSPSSHANSLHLNLGSPDSHHCEPTPQSFYLWNETVDSAEAWENRLDSRPSTSPQEFDLDCPFLLPSSLFCHMTS